MKPGGIGASIGYGVSRGIEGDLDANWRTFKDYDSEVVLKRKNAKLNKQ